MGDREEAGRALAGARGEGRGIDTLPGGLPGDETAAYAIQAAAVEALGRPTCGYKIGATSPAAQQILGTDHPFSAPLFEPDRHVSGATVETPGYGLLGVEPEFALRLGRDVPRRDEPYEADDLRDAVAAVHPVFEVVGLRLPNEQLGNVLAVIADFGANVGLVVGDGVDDWQSHDLSAVTVTASVDGEEVARGNGSAVLGHPLNALAWLANDLSARGQYLKAGEWISTGTCAGVVSFEPGQRVVADHGPFGQVSLTVSISSGGG